MRADAADLIRSLRRANSGAATLDRIRELLMMKTILPTMFAVSAVIGIRRGGAP